MGGVSPCESQHWCHFNPKYRRAFRLWVEKGLEDDGNLRDMRIVNLSLLGCGKLPGESVGVRRGKSQYFNSGEEVGVSETNRQIDTGHREPRHP